MTNNGVGAPTGASRLSGFAFVVGMICLTVLVLTVSTMETLQSHFGNWANPGSSAVTIKKIPSSTPATKIKEVDSTKKATTWEKSNPSDWTEGEMDSEDIVEPLDEVVKPKITTKAKSKSGKASAKSSKATIVSPETKDDKATISSPESEEGKYDVQKLVTNKKDAEKRVVTPTSSKASLLDNVLDARDAMVKDLRKKYGNENFEKIFRYKKDIDDKNTMIRDTKIPIPKKLKHKYRPIRPLGPKDVPRTDHWEEGSDEWIDFWDKADSKFFNSVENLQRKMMIKILLAQEHKSSKKSPPKYVWATGGHSAAAGHGNLFYESYTKVMEAAASNVFASVGIQLDARNYAMGATSSAAEMSMCFKEVYGDDVDIFSWDFGMLEARHYLSGRMLHYITRGVLSSNQQILPAFVGLQSVDGSRIGAMMQLHNAFRGSDDDVAENNGLALFLTDESYLKNMIDAIPDTAEAGTQENIDNMPENIRYFICNGGLEKGDPYCGDNKYNETICPDREGKASWHPGWKHHALLGNAMALFLTEMLVGAVREIEDSVNGDESDDEDLEEMLSNLLQQENEFRLKMLGAQESELPISYKRVYWYNNTDDDWDKYEEIEKSVFKDGSEVFQDRFNTLPRRALFQGPSICHTARLPAQTRFSGALTNQPDMTGNQTIFGRETYFIGMNEEAFLEKYLGDAAVPKEIELVTIQDERQEGCGEYLAKPDYHDYFMASTSKQWFTMTFPNDMEKAAYNYKENEDVYQGILIIVPRFCAFDECEKGFLSHNEFNEGKWEMKVNGIPVTKLTKIGHEAILLEHADGLHFDRNKKGRYNFKFRVNEAESFIKISAFVMY